jgi:long-chain acyl-CoA synthetase
MECADGTAVWVPETTLAVLDRAVATWPEKIALVCGDERLRYDEYGARVTQLARYLCSRGATNARVVILLRNGIDIAIAIFAAQRAGAASVTLNPDYTAAELAPMLADAAPVIVLTHAELADQVQALLPAGCVMLTDDMLADLDVGDAALPTVDPAAIAVIQFTGGTTGRPKGAMLSHRAVATNIAQREAVLPTQAGDERIICMMPLHHSFAAAMCLHLAAYCGGTLFIMPRYRPDLLIDTIEAEQITRLPAGPTVFNGLLSFDGLSRVRVASLCSAYSGSAPLAHATLRRWEDLTGVPIYEGYGQSEAGPVLTYHGPGMALKQGSVGPALPGTHIAIASGSEVGEIMAAGPQIMTGYLNRPEDTAATLIHDGLAPGGGAWLLTGDIGRIDADGYVFIEDRKKDMVIVSGYNVYPREIDEVLMRHPAVREAGAVGVPDAYRGEALWAYVAGDVAEEELRAHCTDLLVKYKQPAVIQFVDILPKTPVGKIDKQALRAMARAAAAETTNHVD